MGITITETKEGARYIGRCLASEYNALSDDSKKKSKHVWVDDDDILLIVESESCLPVAYLAVEDMPITKPRGRLVKLEENHFLVRLPVRDYNIYSGRYGGGIPISLDIVNKNG